MISVQKQPQIVTLVSVKSQDGGYERFTKPEMQREKQGEKQML